MSELKGLLRYFLASASIPPNLSTTTNFTILTEMWIAAISDTPEQLVIELQMSKVLSGISDLDILIDLRMRAPGASVQMIIVGRIGQILPSLLPQINDWATLVKIKRNIHAGSVAEQLVARRMREILPSILPQINDWVILVKMWKIAPDGSRAEQLIEMRMREVIFAVSADAVPWWFLRYLEDPESIRDQHPNLAIHFCEKARILLAELESL